MYLFPFADTIVDNLLPGSAPRILEVQSTLNGDSVILQFNKKMNSPVTFINEFNISTDLMNNPINLTSFKQDDSTTFIFTLKSKTYYENISTLSYSGSDIKSSDNGYLKKVSSLTITNLSLGYPPTVTSAAIRKTGSVYNYIVLKFDRPLADVSTQKIFFTMTINGQIATINALSGNYDSIRFSIYPYFQYNDIVKLSYSGGNVSSLHGGLLAGFSDYMVPNNIPLSIQSENIKSSNQVIIFPNPTKKELNISSETEFNSLSIFNMAGKLIVEKDFGENINYVCLPLTLNEGVYILKLRNNSNLTSTKIVIQ